MKYFYDTEFIEGFHKPLFGKPRHFIELISIGIFAEDGRSYYAISNEFNPKLASDWVQKNVIEKLKYEEPWEHDPSLSKVYGGIHAARKIGKSNKQIASEIFDFFNPHIRRNGSYDDLLMVDQRFCSRHNIVIFPPNDKSPLAVFRACPELYGYYSDYDHVLLASLFGTMMDLPIGMPMYTKDIKQMVDDWVIKAMPELKKHNKNIVTIEDTLDELKRHHAFPKNPSEHNALADAKWNYELYKFITS